MPAIPIPLLSTHTASARPQTERQLTVFGRFNYSPSKLIQRASGSLPLNGVKPITVTTLTATAGQLGAISPFAANDFRFNYSKTEASSYSYLDNFGGGAVPTTLPFPSPYSSRNAIFIFGIFGLTNGNLEIGSSSRQVQRQINLVDSLSVQKGTHNLKFGVDYRRLSPEFNPFLYVQGAYFLSVQSAEADNLFFAALNSARHSTFLLQNLGAFAQDSWRLTPRLTLTYGLRWDLDLAPSSLDGPSIPR